MVDRKLTHAYEPNPLLAYVYRRFFDHIEVDERWVASVRAAAARGSVVYVLRNLSFLDFLALDHLTKRHGLPQVRYANDLGLWLLEPLGKGWLGAVAPGKPAPPAEQLAEALESGGSAALFLKRSPSTLERAARPSGQRGRSEGDELIAALIDLQRRRERPILLCPQVFVWTKRRDTHGAGVVDALLGPREWPGKVRTAAQFLANYRNVVFRAGEPLDLAAWLQQPAAAGADDVALVRRLTYSLLRKVERERHTILGPAFKPPDRVREEVVRSPKLRETIRELAGEGDKERLLLTVRAYGMLRELEAQPEPDVVRGFELALDQIFARIYDGLEIDEEGLDRVREAAKQGTLVLLPSHKSHFDYLVLSYLCVKRSLQLPAIAAGDNLSFFPMGPLFRRAGAFFIRRSFKGDRLYAAVVDAYIRRLLRDGHSMEFFLEGGRSRTGKLLPPKVGLLSMVVDAALAVDPRPVFFVPVSIGYERIVEARSYVRELTGGEKHKEDAAGLLRGTQALGGRYGRLNVQFGDSITLDAVRRAAPGGGAGLEGRELVTRLAHRVMGEINRVTAVTPGAVVALALLTTAKRGVPHAELVASAERFVRLLASMGARVSSTLADASGHVHEHALREAAQLFVDADVVRGHLPGQSLDAEAPRRAHAVAGPDVIYTVADDKRMALDLSKNIIVHFFIPRALVATGLLMGERRAVSANVPRAVLAERVRQLSRLFKFEFMFRADASFDDNFAAAVAEMSAAGELCVEGTDMRAGDGHDGLSGRAWLETYASILRPFLEGYRVAARQLATLVKAPATKKDLTKRALTQGQRMFLAGEIERPEAVCRPVLENALLAFIDQGYVSVVEGKLALAESFSSPAAVKAIERRIAGYVNAELGAEA